MVLRDHLWDRGFSFSDPTSHLTDMFALAPTSSSIVSHHSLALMSSWLYCKQLEVKDLVCFSLSLFRILRPSTKVFTSNRNLFLTVLEAKSPRSGCQQIHVLVRNFLPIAGCRLLTSHCSLTQCSSLGLSIRALIPFMRAPPL